MILPQEIETIARAIIDVEFDAIKGEIDKALKMNAIKVYSGGDVDFEFPKYSRAGVVKAAEEYRKAGWDVIVSPVYSGQNVAHYRLVFSFKNN